MLMWGWGSGFHSTAILTLCYLMDFIGIKTTQILAKPSTWQFEIAANFANARSANGKSGSCGNKYGKWHYTAAAAIWLKQRPTLTTFAT